jgi:uncharacterized cupredoxin-like copper-binding protein
MEIERLEREIRRTRSGRDGWTISIFVLSAFALVAALVFVGIGIKNIDGSGSTPGAATAIDATLSEFAITLPVTEVAEGGTINVTNTGTLVHNVSISGTDVHTIDLNPGDSAPLSLAGFAPGTYEILCLIPGHASSGMTAEITVVADKGSGTSSADAMGMTATEHASMSAGGAMTAEEAAAMDQAMVDSITAFPATTEGKGNQVLEPTILPDGTKHFELTASIVDWEVSPGKTVQAWAYNGQVPGPRINLEVGDKVEVQLTNDLPLGTDIHWHGVDVPNGQDGVAPITQNLVAPGETYTYSFTTTEPAIAMYHAHTHGEQAVPNGLFGTLYIGDVAAPAGRTVSGIPIPADLTIAQDIPMVLNDAGVIGLTLNGKSFPATDPIVANNGDWVKVTYFNEGLQAHPMHLHGFEQIVYAKDGEPLDSPYAADTILVAPGERYTALFHADQVGTWVYHCHILNHVESETGMFGMVTAVVVQ